MCEVAHKKVFGRIGSRVPYGEPIQLTTHFSPRRAQTDCGRAAKTQAKIRLCTPRGGLSICAVCCGALVAIAAPV